MSSTPIDEYRKKGNDLVGTTRAGDTEAERESTGESFLQHAEWLGNARVTRGLNNTWILDVGGCRAWLPDNGHATECDDSECRPQVEVFGRRWRHSGALAEVTVAAHGGLVAEEVNGHILRAMTHPRGYDEYFHELRTGSDPRFGGMTEAEYERSLATTPGGCQLLIPTEAWRRSGGR